MFLAVLVVAASALLSAPAVAFDCSVSCPTGEPEEAYTIGGINETTGCTLIYDYKDTEPLSWSRLNFSATDSVVCDSCDAEFVEYGSCERVSYTDPTTPYNVHYYCTYTKPEDLKNPSIGWVPCCTYSGPAACRGACGIATCSIGDCVNNKCVNTECPADADCVCGSRPRLPS